MALQQDYWSSGGNTFNIGTRGDCYLQLKLDEKSGSTANDTSREGNDFTFPGGANDPTWIGAGKFDDALSFDGGDYLSKASKVIDTTSDFSVVLYVKPDGVSGTQYLLHRNLAWYLRLENDEIGFWVDCTTDANYITNNANLTAGTWYRIAAVYDQSAKSMKIFVDGSECTYSTSTDGVGGEVNTAGTIYLARDSAGANYFTGDLDEIQIFQRALEDEEVVALYAVSPIDVPKRGIDRSKEKNHCIVVGNDSGGNALYGEAYVDATTGIITLGTPGGGFTYRSMRKTSRLGSDQATLNNVAAQFLEDARLQTSHVKFDVEISAAWAVDVGDYIVVEDTRLRLDDVYRIQARTVTLGIVTLEVDRAEGKADKDIFDLSRFEEYGIYSVSIEQIPLGEQSWTTNIEFTPGIASANPHNSVEWDNGAAGNATITFSNGTSKTINAGNLAAMAANTTYFMYYTIDDTSLNNTTNYADLAGTDDILIAKVITPGAAETTKHVEIIMMESALGDKYGTSLFSSGVIITPDFRTAWNTGVAGGPAGFRISASEIAGYSGGTTKEFYVSAADGLAYFYGGLCYIDSDGINIKHDGASTTTGIRFRDNLGAQVGQLILDIGDGVSLMGSAGTYLGNVAATAYYGVITNMLWLQAASGQQIELHPGSGSYTESHGHIHPNTGSQNSLGTNSLTWLEGHFDDIYGDVRYTDMHFTRDDLRCYSCGREFRRGDKMSIIVREFDEDKYLGREILGVPVHVHCVLSWIKAKLTGWLEKIGIRMD